MGSELTDSWRAKYPGAYDNVSDDQLEKAIIAKFPGAYDHLSSDNTHVDDTSVKSTDTKLIESKSNEQPNNKSNKVSELWNKFLAGTNDTETQLMKDKGITNIQGPGLMTIPGLDKLGETIKNKGINTGNYWAGFGGSIAKDLIDLASSGFDPRAAGIKKSPNDLFSVGHDFNPNELTNIKAKAPEIAQRAMSNQPSMPRSNNPSSLMRDDLSNKPNFGPGYIPNFTNEQVEWNGPLPEDIQRIFDEGPKVGEFGNKNIVRDYPSQSNPNEAALSEDTIGKQIAAHRSAELDKVRGSVSDIPDNDVARKLELERKGTIDLSNNSNTKVILDRELRGAKPRYNIGQDTYIPKFESDLDKALFIIAQKNPSARNADYLKFVMKHTGLNESDAISAGQSLRNQLKNIFKSSEPGEVDIPRINNFENKKLTSLTNNLTTVVPSINKQPLSADEINKLFTNTKPLTEGTTIQFGRTNSPKINAEGPKVTSLKPATPELIAQAQKTGPDVIHLKTADKTQLSNAAEYGYQFEGINSDGSLRLRKNAIDIPSNDNLPPNELSGGSGGGDDEPPNDNNRQHLGPDLDKRKATIAQEIMNLPRGIMASWDLSAPFRQGLGLIHRPEWWKSWGSMFKSFGSENAFRAVQDNIASKPLFKQFNGQPSFAEKAGLKLTDLTDLSSREEQIMSTWAEKVPGVRPSNRAYTAFLNKLRADTFESLMDSAKVINKSSGEIDMGLAKELANYINTSTGRGSLGSLEKYAPALNSIFFSPRLIASRLQMLNPVYYMTANPIVRKEAIKSLLSIAGAGQAITQLGKLAGGTVESDPTSSDFGKLKIGNTRIDPYGGFQQYIVAANRLLQGRTKSTVSSKETDLTEGKFGKQTRFDVAERFGESKLNPLIGLAITILRGKNLAGQKVDLPEEAASKFIPLFIQDLKTVATENPNLIPFYNELGLDKISLSRGSLALPGAVGFGIQNYPSK